MVSSQARFRGSAFILAGTREAAGSSGFGGEQGGGSEQSVNLEVSLLSPGDDRWLLESLWVIHRDGDVICGRWQASLLRAGGFKAGLPTSAV